MVTSADIMLGFTLFAAQMLNTPGNFPSLTTCLERITARPAFATTLEKLSR